MTAEQTAELTAAVIGATVGTWHADGLRATPGVRLVGICDVVPALAEEAADRLGIPGFSSVEELLGETRPDLVVVATGESHHVGPTVLALDTGAHVMCEKILAHSLDAGREILAAVERAPGSFAVNYNYRTIPRMLRLRDAVRQGAIGDVVTVSIDVHSWVWHHALDHVLWIFGPVQEVLAAVASGARSLAPRVTDDFLYWPDPAAAAVLRMESGALVSISSWLPGTDEERGAQLAEQMMRIEVQGTTGRIAIGGIVVDDLNGELRAGDLPAEPAPCTLVDTFHASVGAFASAIVAGERPPSAGITDGWEMLRLEAAIKRAADSGSAVRLEDVR
jgi:predicted dehydrogenase